MSDDPHGTTTRLSRSRRRPRPRTRASPADADADEGEGVAETQRTLVGVLDSALSYTRMPQINAILARRQGEGPPPPDPDRGDDVRDAAGEPFPTADERADLGEDVLGRPPPDVERAEGRMAALRREVDRLPKSERRALTRAMKKHPLLFVNCPHTKMILEQEQDEGGNFDPAAAARRAARYWDARRRLLGDRACYDRGSFPEPQFADWRRYHRRMLAVMDDPDVDAGGDLREEAEAFLLAVRDAKIDALNDELGEAIEDETYSEEEREEMLIARTLAVESADDLKLQFLRAEDFIEGKAAERLVRYWKTGLRLFGVDFRYRKCATLRDDMEDCSELFRLHQVRLLPEEDDFGRSIVVRRRIFTWDGEEQEGGDDRISFERMAQLGINEDHFGKVLWYTIHAALERESCQRNGLVLVIAFGKRYGTGTHFKKLRRHSQVTNDVLGCVPAKVRAIHVLFGSSLPWWLGAIGTVLHLALRRRLVVYGGEMEENVAKMCAVSGIKAEHLPTDLGGTVDAEYFARWLEDRRAAGL